MWCDLLQQEQFYDVALGFYTFKYEIGKLFPLTCQYELNVLCTMLWLLSLAPFVFRLVASHHQRFMM